VRIVVSGIVGQVAQSLAERGPLHGAIVRLVGRPECDLTDERSVFVSLRRSGGDVIVNAAGYTAVDQAETEVELARAVNDRGAGYVAETAAALGLPVVHLSTDYVFDGSSERPYCETDAVNPVSVYGLSKLGGERRVAAATPNHAILRTAWVYSPFGKNFVKTMLRLAFDRAEISVVADQRGSPTSALDLADGVIGVCRNLLERPHEAALRGIFHMAGQGFATWADLASEVFVQSAGQGGPSARVNPIGAADYPTPAQRPANSMLDCAKLAAVHGVTLAEWRSSTATCVNRLVHEGAAKGTQ